MVEINKNKYLKILIVDDDQDILDLMAEEFTGRGHNVVVAISGNKAITILKDDSFDVILSDYKMHNGDGMKVLNFVKTLIPKPTFFFLSANPDLNIENLKELGADDYFFKPHNIDLLISKVEKSRS